jgi:CRISPR-associated protein Csb1
MATANTASTKQISSDLAAGLGGEGPKHARWASALRLRCRLQPAGGPGTKIMPPTYSSSEGPTYIEEHRRIGDSERRCFLLDGIASQANRFEAALAERVRTREIPLPTIEVDQDEFGLHSGLEFSHRCFDAWIEDAHLDGERFGETTLYKRLAASRSRHDLTSLIEAFPVGILLGCLASRSKNPQGATRLARILSSELIAIDAVTGDRPASKIDLHQVSAAIKLYESSDQHARFAVDEQEAIQEREKSKLFAAGNKDKAGKPSTAGYGNVTPGLAAHGGITLDHALQIATVSMPALRECGFPDAKDNRDPDRDVAGRMMLAALALRMLALQVEQGYDLRSGCLLVPEAEPTVEMVGRLGRTVASWPLIEMHSDELLNDAIAQGHEHGLPWDGQTINLVASAEQLTLLRRSLASAETPAG